MTDADLIAKVVNQSGIRQLLSYGPGMALFLDLQGKIDHAVEMQAYEPASSDPKMAERPQPCSMTVCMEYLEHLPPPDVDGALDDLEELTLEVGLIRVKTRRSLISVGAGFGNNSFGSSKNTIEEGPYWWLPKILQRFELQTYQKTPDGFYVLVTAGVSKGGY